MGFKIDPAEFYSPAEVAEKLGISERTLANWRWSGRGPAPTRGHNGRTRVWYSGENVLRFLEERTACWPTEAA